MCWARASLGIRALILSLALLGFSACETQHETLVEKADREALDQKSQLAKYLYLQVVQKRKEKDDIRFRALKGLAIVSLTQLYDYRSAVVAFDKIFEEYGSNSRYQSEVYELRLMASKTWRVHLQQPDRSLDVLSPLLQDRLFRPEFGQELGRVYLALGDYSQARHWLVQTWEKSKEKKNCSILKATQLDLVQVFSLQENCDQVLHWANESLGEGCSPEVFSLALEKAHCFEMKGEVNKAVQLYEELLQDDPKNMRAHFFLESLKKRQREKEKK